METEAAAQESLGLGKLGTQAEKDRRLKKKQVWRFFPSFSFTYFLSLRGIKKRMIGEFPGGSVDQGSSVAIAMAQVTAVAWVPSLTQDLPHASSVVQRKRERERIIGNKTIDRS